MSRRVVTADDVLRVAAAGGAELMLSPADRVTPLARDVARDKGVRLVVGAAEVVPEAGSSPPPVRRSGVPTLLTHVPGAAWLPLGPFPVDVGRPEMDVRVADVITGRDGVAMSAGVMSLREGTFAWTLDYDEVEYVIEGELHITSGGQRIVGRPGDVIAVPRGSSITFGTPSWARFLYVTYPADWVGAP